MKLDTVIAAAHRARRQFAATLTGALSRRMFLRGAGALMALGCAIVANYIHAAEPTGNLSPADALKAFETEPGFTVELVAAEPLTVDPVALAFDERGRLFVAECRDYPVGSPDGRPLGVIALLEDVDGDGRMDTRTEFATGIKFPNGVMCWRGGVIVTAAPDVWWLADTNGDGRADVKELLLTGFDTNSTSQLRANDPTLGPDGWVYIAGGLRSGKVSSPKRPGVTLDTDKGDVRFKPDTGELEIVAGKSQFGLAFDDAANRFACMNRIQSQHAPLPTRYLDRNPFVVSPGALQNCPEIHENTLMTRYTAGAARYYPISANLTTADSHVGTYSAACAVHIYRGEALPAEYRGAAFSCDPTGNLVRGDRLEKSGGTFAARRIHDGTEALRSRDNWFRPVFLADGPDGALYIADMYRKTIEHPDYLPGEVRKHTDFESGKEMGRIWRLGGKSKAQRSRFKAASRAVTEMVKSLSAPAPWARDTAFRLLVERSDRRAVPALRTAFRTTTASGPAVLQLRLLDVFTRLDDDLLARAMNHTEPAVRQNAVLLAEPRLANSAKLQERVLALATDADPHVRFQVALSLGEMRDPRIVPALAGIATQQAADRWTRAAIISSLPDRALSSAMIETIAANQGSANEGLLALAADLGRQLGASADGAARSAAFRQAWHSVWHADPALGMATVVGFANGVGDAFRTIASAEPAELQPLFAQAHSLAIRASVAVERRFRAVELLAFDESDGATALLGRLLDPAQPQELQQAAARALFQPRRAASLAPLLAADRWNALTPTIRNVVLGRLASQPALAGLLLDALDSGVVPAGVLTPAQRDQLKKLKDETLRARAEKLFAQTGGGRERAFEDAKAALRLTPAPANGRAVFEKSCASCHRFNQMGVAVGPDLFDIRQQPKESILFHIVVPEAEIAPNFVNYECELKDGRTLSGLLAAETSTQITLRMAQGVEEILPRAQIAKLTASRLSLMPQELEKAMTPQELADLLAYLRGEQ